MAGEVVADEIAGAVQGPDVRAVRAWRGGGVVALAAHVLLTVVFAHWLAPEFLALRADAHERDLWPVLAGQEDAIAPDRGRGAGLGRHGQLPGDVLGLAPLGRQAGLLADAVVSRAAPLRPVVGDRGAGESQGEDGCEQPAGSYTANHGGNLGWRDEIPGGTVAFVISQNTAECDGVDRGFHLRRQVPLLQQRDTMCGKERVDATIHPNRS